MLKDKPWLFSSVGEQIVSHAGFDFSRTLSAGGQIVVVVIPLPPKFKKILTFQKQQGKPMLVATISYDI